MFTKKIAAVVALGTMAVGGVGASSAMASNGDAGATAKSAVSQGAKDPHQAAMAKELASKLGVSEATVTKALDSMRAQRQGALDKERAQVEAKIAKALGISTEKLQAAIKAAESKDSKSDRGGPERHRVDFSQVAKSLGITQDKLMAAFEANRPQRSPGKGSEARRDFFVTDLAKALGVDEAKVESALKSMSHRGFARGDRGGFPHHGGFGEGHGPAAPSDSTAAPGASSGS